MRIVLKFSERSLSLSRLLDRRHLNCKEIWLYLRFTLWFIAWRLYYVTRCKLLSHQRNFLFFDSLYTWFWRYFLGLLMLMFKTLLSLSKLRNLSDFCCHLILRWDWLLWDFNRLCFHLFISKFNMLKSRLNRRCLMMKVLKRDRLIWECF